MQECKIQLGRIICNARREKGLSQRDLCKMIADKYSIIIDWIELSKIENCRVDVRSRDYNCLIQVLSEIFKVDYEWLEDIRQQTDTKLMRSLIDDDVFFEHYEEPTIIFRMPRI